MAHDRYRYLTTTSLPIQHRVRRLAGRHDQPDIRAVAAAAFLSAASGAIYTWSVFVGPMTASFRADPAWLAVAFTVALIVMTLTVTTAGRVAQRWPRRLIVASALGTVLSTAAVALAPTVTVLLVAMGAWGAAGGLGYTVATGVAAAALPRHRGLSIGFVLAGAAVGPIVLGPMASMATAAVGWRTTMLLLGAVTAVLTALPGMGIDCTVASGAAVDARVGPPRDSEHRRVVVPFLWAVFALVGLVGLGVYGHAAEIAAAGGMTASLTGVAVAALSAGDLSGRLVAAGTSARTRSRSLVVATVAATAGAAVLLAIGGSVGAALGLSLVGAGYGSATALVPANLSDHVRRDDFSRAHGWLFTSWGLGAVLGPLGAAALRSPTGYDTTMAVAVAVAALSCAAATALHLRLRRDQAPSPDQDPGRASRSRISRSRVTSSGSAGAPSSGSGSEVASLKRL